MIKAKLYGDTPVTLVQALDNHETLVRFEDGSEGPMFDIDLSDFEVSE